MTNTLTNSKNRTDLMNSWAASATQETIALADLDTTLQTRVAGTDNQLAAEYRIAMKSGVTFPPVEVFLIEDAVGNEIAYLADGYHRRAAYALLGTQEIVANIYRGRTFEEAKLFAHFSNVANGREASKADVRSAIQHLLDMDTERSLFFKSKYSLDMSKLSQWVVATQTFVRSVTRDLRDHLETMRDAEIALNAKAEMSQRESAAAVGVDQKTVGNSLRKYETHCDIPQEHSPAHKASTPSLFDRLYADRPDSEELMSKSERDARTEVQTILVLNEGLSDEQHQASLKALEKANKQGFDTLIRNMDKSRKKKQAKGIKPKADHTQNLVNALGAAVMMFNVAKDHCPDLSEAAAALRADVAGLEDLTALTNFVNELRAKTLS